MTQSKEFRCPVCGDAFRDDVVFHDEPLSRDSDLMPRWENMDPLLLGVHTCPVCLFSGEDTDFENQVPWRLKVWIMENGPGRLESDSPSRKYTLAARCKAFSRRNLSEVGELYLKASWCARVEGDVPMERLSQKRARECFIEALKGLEGESLEKARLVFLVAEISRRLGDFDQAVEWFSRVSHPSFKDAAGRLLSLAKTGDSRGMPFFSD